MDCELINGLPTINNLCTIACIGCVLPTYFLVLRLTIYRLMLSLGIVFGVATWAFVTMLDFSCSFFIPWPFMNSFPNIVLIAILAGIAWVTRVNLWSTVVLTCALANWAGFAAILWILA